jgi:thiol:disulfide interchange protein DsbC
MHRFTSLVSLLSLSFFIMPMASAEGATEEVLTSKVQEVLGPDANVNSVKPSAISGLYEIVINNGKVVYMTKDGNYVIEGDVIDLVNRANITDISRSQARADGFESIDVNQLIEFSPENPQHMLYVYTDIDCGYCQKFHKEIKKLNDNGIGVRYLAFPRAGLQSPAYVAAESAWCAEDSQQALTDAKAGKAISPATCDDRVKKQFAMGQAMGVKGTPSVFIASGKELGGYIPADDLINYFNGGL